MIYNRLLFRAVHKVRYNSVHSQYMDAPHRFLSRCQCNDLVWVLCCMQIMYQDGGRNSAEYGPKVMQLFQRPCVLVVAEFLSIIFEFANFILLNCSTERGGRGGRGELCGYNQLYSEHI